MPYCSLSQYYAAIGCTCSELLSTGSFRLPSSEETCRIAVCFFTSRSARSARTAGTKIDLRFPRLFVSLFVCLFVRPHLSRAQNITSYVTMQLQCTAAFGGLQAKLQQMKVVLCCLDGENVVGSREDPGFLAYSY